MINEEGKKKKTPAGEKKEGGEVRTTYIGIFQLKNITGAGWRQRIILV